MLHFELFSDALYLCRYYAADRPHDSFVPILVDQLSYLIDLEAERRIDRERLDSIRVGIIATRFDINVDPTFTELLHKVQHVVERDYLNRIIVILYKGPPPINHKELSRRAKIILFTKLSMKEFMTTECDWRITGISGFRAHFRQADGTAKLGTDWAVLLNDEAELKRVEIVEKRIMVRAFVEPGLVIEPGDEAKMIATYVMNLLRNGWKPSDYKGEPGELTVILE